MTLKVFTDGGALGNPGRAACAYIISNGEKTIAKGSRLFKWATNNYAEYSGLVLALEKIKELLAKNGFKNLRRIDVFADSSLMVNQLNGLYKVKNSAIREFVVKIRLLETEIGVFVNYKHVPREKNTVADSLVKQALRV